MHTLLGAAAVSVFIAGVTAVASAAPSPAPLPVQPGAVVSSLVPAHSPIPKPVTSAVLPAAPSLSASAPLVLPGAVSADPTPSRPAPPGPAPSPGAGAASVDSPAVPGSSVARSSTGTLIATATGVELSRDGGRSWTFTLRVPANALSGPSVGAFGPLAVATFVSDGDIAGVWVSHDGGVTWPEEHGLGRYSGSTPDGSSNRADEVSTGHLVVGPHAIFAMLEADDSGGMRAGADPQMLRSLDSGRSWTGDPVRIGTTDVDFSDVAFGRDGVAVAATWDGIARSTDGGLTWTWALHGMDMVALAASPDGFTWLASGGSARAENVNVPGQQNTWRSTDQGRSWVEVEAVTGAQEQVPAFPAGDPEPLTSLAITGTRTAVGIGGLCGQMNSPGPCTGHLWVTHDLGAHWSELPARAAHVVALADGTAVTDTGYRLTPAGLLLLSEDAADDDGTLTVVGGTVYTSSAAGVFRRTSLHGPWRAATLPAVPAAAPAPVTAPNGDPYAYPGWVTTDIDATHSVAVFSDPTSTVYPDLPDVPVDLSSDHGSTWQRARGAVPGALGLGYDGDTSIAAATAGNDIVLVDMNVVISTDAGAHWQAPTLPPGCHPDTVSSQGNVAWLPCNDDDPAGVDYAVSLDGGHTWTARTAPTHPDSAGNTRPVQVGTDGLAVVGDAEGEGFEQTTDDGLTWQHIQPELPVDQTALPVTPQTQSNVSQPGF